MPPGVCVSERRAFGKKPNVQRKQVGPPIVSPKETFRREREREREHMGKGRVIPHTRVRSRRVRVCGLCAGGWHGGGACASRATWVHMSESFLSRCVAGQHTGKQWSPGILSQTFVWECLHCAFGDA